MPSTLDLAARLSAIVAAHHEIVTSVPDLKTVMNVAAVQTQQITHADGSAVEEVVGDELIYRAVSGRTIAQEGIRLKIDGSLSGAALKAGQTLRCDDAEIDTRTDREACRRLGIRSMIVVPLIHRKRPLGVLKAFSQRPQFFSDLDFYCVDLLGSMTSVALMLADELRQRQTSEERYRLLFEKNVAGVFRSTRDGRILDCNSAFAECLGYSSRTELLGVPTWDLYQQRSDRESFLSTLVRERALTNVRIPLKRKDGSLLTGIVSVSLIPGENDEDQLLGTLVSG